ncbi:unnamed protein product, partial [Mesorhabditis belari]|uniref:Uncharacterized protein n=1 Tax=Mesorhabditis belari TaxID=2138241 RepID=A0AAF3E882_9BILA
MAVGATVATENDLLCRRIDDETPPMLNEHPVSQIENDYLIEQQEIMLPAPPQSYLDTGSQERRSALLLEMIEFERMLPYHEMGHQIPAQTAVPIMSTAGVQPTLMVQSYQQHLQQQAVHCTDGLGMRIYPQEMPSEMPVLDGQYPQQYPQQSFTQAYSQIN